MIASKYSGAIALLAFLPMALSAQRAAEDAVPLKNWATPLYWQPNAAEREAAGRSGAQIQFSANAVSNTALTFVAITPCRLVDTRGAASGFIGSTPFNGPYLQPQTTVAFPVQSTTEAQTTAPTPCGTIPSIAQAYSLNLTVVPHPFGNPVNFVTMWPNSPGVPTPTVSTLNDQQGAVLANAAIVPAGTTFGGINVYAYGPADVIIDMNGFYAAPTDEDANTAIGAGTLLNNSGYSNTASGYYALAANTSGSNNTAIGGDALNANATGSQNTAVGNLALVANTTGTQNTAGGFAALAANTSGSNNTADGYEALGLNTTGSNNAASGFEALFYNTIGNWNTAMGAAALQYNTAGSNNTANGYEALQHNTTGGQNTASGVVAMATNTTGVINTAVGYGALQFNTTGNANTASGAYALSANTTGGGNAAYGTQALVNNTTGSLNTATGEGALGGNTTGSNNTASGWTALGSTTGNNNTATGAGSLVLDIGGSNNVASGVDALHLDTSGNNNAALGYEAGYYVLAGDNIDIGNTGTASDSGTIRIGTTVGLPFCTPACGPQTSFFAAGIRGATTGNNDAIPVVIDSNGQLGTVSSSRRFKEDIQDMGEASSGLLRLRPVTFRYTRPFDDGLKPVQYGLIAEEVTEVYPDLVAHSADGQIETVKYQVLDSMLLNEVQKQAEEIRELKARLAVMEKFLVTADRADR